MFNSFSVSSQLVCVQGNMFEKFYPNPGTGSLFTLARHLECTDKYDKYVRKITVLNHEGRLTVNTA